MQISLGSEKSFGNQANLYRIAPPLTKIHINLVLSKNFQLFASLFY